MNVVQEKALEIYRKYHNYYDGEIQGCCLLIADEIQRAVGGDVVAGYLTFFGGSQQRSHPDYREPESEIDAGK